MIGVDSTFFVQLAVKELPRHVAAHDLLRREVIDNKTFGGFELLTP